ncbi:hypothetical protein LIER_26848 [Lithospermum erythrorhizon]|uniref:Uncharacterized protein n=1 Tax=Lithospermum erythrorhizon TaxID=34254 RepID=A0AAV3R9V3_LITER
MQDENSSWKWPVGRRFKGAVQEFGKEFQILMEQRSGEDQVVCIHGANNKISLFNSSITTKENNPYILNFKIQGDSFVLQDKRDL